MHGGAGCPESVLMDASQGSSLCCLGIGLQHNIGQYDWLCKGRPWRMFRLFGPACPALPRPRPEPAPNPPRPASPRLPPWVQEGLVLMADEVYQTNIYAAGKQFNSFKKVCLRFGCSASARAPRLADCEAAKLPSCRP